MLIGPAQQFRSEPDRECEDTNARPPADEIVSHFVHEDEEGQNQQEWNDVAGHELQGIKQICHGLSLSACHQHHRPSRTEPKAI